MENQGDANQTQDSQGCNGDDDAGLVSLEGMTALSSLVDPAEDDTAGREVTVSVTTKKTITGRVAWEFKIDIEGTNEGHAAVAAVRETRERGRARTFHISQSRQAPRNVAHPVFATMMPTMMPKIPSAEAKISTMRILTKSEASWASARAQAEPAMPTEMNVEVQLAASAESITIAAHGPLSATVCYSSAAGEAGGGISGGKRHRHMQR